MCLSIMCQGVAPCPLSPIRWVSSGQGHRGLCTSSSHISASLVLQRQGPMLRSWWSPPGCTHAVTEHGSRALLSLVRLAGSCTLPPCVSRFWCFPPKMSLYVELGNRPRQSFRPGDDGQIWLAAAGAVAALAALGSIGHWIQHKQDSWPPGLPEAMACLFPVWKNFFT